MSDDLISRSKLIERLDVLHRNLIWELDYAPTEGLALMWRSYCDCIAIIKRAIVKTRAVDAVKVVRCKDCKHYRYDEDFERTACDIFIMGTDSEHFCSYGERKDNATD